MSRSIGMRLAVAIGTASTVVTLAACGASNPQASSSGGGTGAKPDPGVNAKTKTITLGGFSTQSGPAAAAVAVSDAANAYFQTVNAAGGVNGWKIKFLRPDDGGDPARALQAIKNQVQGNQVFAITYSSGSPSNRAVVPYLATTDVPYVGPGESGDAYLDSFTKSVFPFAASYSQQANFLAQYAMDKLGAKRIGLIYQDDASGQPVHKAFKPFVEAAGGQVVAELPYALSDVDFSAMGQKLAAAKPDVVVQWGSQGAGGLVTQKQAAEAAGVQVPWLSGFFNATQQFVDLDPKTIEGTYFESWLEPTVTESPAIKQYEAGITKYAPAAVKLGNVTLNGWAGAQLMVEGLKAITANGQVPTRAALTKELDSWGERAIGTVPGVNWTAKSHQPSAKAWMLQYKDGKLQVLSGPSPLPSAEG